MKVEISGIKIKPADNGGCVVSCYKWVDMPTNSESYSKDETFVYEEDELDKAKEKLIELHMESYKSEKKEMVDNSDKN